MAKDSIKSKDHVAMGLSCAFCSKQVAAGEAHTCKGLEAATRANESLELRDNNE